MNGYVLLGCAIAAEIVATSSLKAADGFTRLWPSVVVLVGYAIAFVLLAQVVKHVPLGIAYALWSGIGIIGTTLVAVLIYGQKPDLPAMVGMGLIISGVMVINLFSHASAH